HEILLCRHQTIAMLDSVTRVAAASGIGFWGFPQLGPVCAKPLCELAQPSRKASFSLTPRGNDRINDRSAPPFGRLFDLAAPVPRTIGTKAGTIGMSGSALYETFARAPLAFERGEGCWLVEAGGARYLDFA